MRNQTNLTIRFMDDTIHTFYGVSTLNTYKNENGFLVIEFDEAMLPIVYIPIDHIRYFDTQIVRNF